MPKMIAHARRGSKWFKYGLFEDGSFKVNPERTSKWHRIGVALKAFYLVSAPPEQRPRPATLRKPGSRQPGTRDPRNYRWMRADPPLAKARTCSTVAMVVSPGKVVSSAPCAQPSLTASSGVSPLSRP